MQVYLCHFDLDQEGDKFQNEQITLSALVNSPIILLYQQDMLFQTTAAYWISSILQTILCKP